MFEGAQVPFLCGVLFKPSTTKYRQGKMEDRPQYGVFLGYVLAPGAKWSGQYLVCDSSDFVRCNLSVDADHSDFPLKPHYTSIVKMCKEGVHFPLKAESERKTKHLPGLQSPGRHPVLRNHCQLDAPGVSVVLLKVLKNVKIMNLLLQPESQICFLLRSA